MSNVTYNPEQTALYNSGDLTTTIDNIDYSTTLAVNLGGGHFVRFNQFTFWSSTPILAAAEEHARTFDINVVDPGDRILLMIYPTPKKTISHGFPERRYVKQNLVKILSVAELLRDDKYTDILTRVYGNYVIRELYKNDTKRYPTETDFIAKVRGAISKEITYMPEPWTSNIMDISNIRRERVENILGNLSAQAISISTNIANSALKQSTNSLVRETLGSLFDAPEAKAATDADLNKFTKAALKDTLETIPINFEKYKAAEPVEPTWLAPAIPLIYTEEELDCLDDPGATRIGFTTFLIPPDKISYSRRTIVSSEPMLRSGDSTVKSRGQSIQTIDFHFTTTDAPSINKVVLPLIRQFQKAPFLPIDNIYINETLNIEAVALCNIQIQTVEGFPNQLDVTFSVEEFNWQNYLPGESSFDSTICYPLLKLWTYSHTNCKPIDDAGFTGKFDILLPNEVRLAHMAQSWSQSNIINPETEKENTELTYFLLTEAETYFKGSADDKEYLAKLYPTTNGLRSDWLMKIVPAVNLTASNLGSDLKPKDVVLIKPASSGAYNYLFHNTNATPLTYRASDITIKASDGLGKQHTIEGATIASQAEINKAKDDFRKSISPGGALPQGSTNFIFMFIAETNSSVYKNPSAGAALEKQFGQDPKAIKSGSAFRNSATNVEDPNKAVDKWDAVKLPSFVVEKISASTENLFARNAAQMMGSPNHQFLGRADTIITVEGTITTDEDVAALTTLLDIQEYLTRRYAGIAGYEGYIRLDNEIAGLLGIQYVVPINCRIDTMENMPNERHVTLMFTKYDELQKKRSSVNEITPNKIKSKDGNKLTLDNGTEVEKTSDTLFEHAVRAEDFRKVLTGMELYPDLKLPKLMELKRWVEGMIASQDTLDALLDSYNLDSEEFPWTQPFLKAWLTHAASFLPPDNATTQGFAEPDFYCGPTTPYGEDSVDAIIHASAGYSVDNKKITVKNQPTHNKTCVDRLGKKHEILPFDFKSKDKTRFKDTTDYLSAAQSAYYPNNPPAINTNDIKTSANIVRGTSPLPNDIGSAIANASTLLGVPYGVARAIIQEEGGFSKHNLQTDPAKAASMTGANQYYGVGQVTTDTIPAANARISQIATDMKKEKWDTLVAACGLTEALKNKVVYSNGKYKAQFAPIDRADMQFGALLGLAVMKDRYATVMRDAEAHCSGSPSYRAILSVVKGNAGARPGDEAKAKAVDSLFWQIAGLRYMTGGKNASWSKNIIPDETFLSKLVVDAANGAKSPRSKQSMLTRAEVIARGYSNTIKNVYKPLTNITTTDDEHEECKKLYEMANIDFKYYKSKLPFKLLVWSTHSKDTAAFSPTSATRDGTNLIFTIGDSRVRVAILPQGATINGNPNATNILTLKLSHEETAGESLLSSLVPAQAGPTAAIGIRNVPLINMCKKKGMTFNSGVPEIYAYLVPVSFQHYPKFTKSETSVTLNGNYVLNAQSLPTNCRHQLIQPQVDQWLNHPNGCLVLQYLYDELSQPVSEKELADPKGYTTPPSFLSVDPTLMVNTDPMYYPLDEMFIRESLDSKTNRPNYDHHRDMWHDMRKFSMHSRLAAAFPTYSLILVDGGSWLRFWRLYDHLFGLTTVQSIEVFKSRKTPADVCNISLANPYGKLTKEPHWPFRETDRHWTLSYVMGAMQNALTGTWSQEEIARWNNVRNSLLLKAGCRIHLRMGYGSDASKLPVAFNGTITDVTPGSEVVEIAALGDGAELLNKLMTNATNSEGTAVKRSHSLFGAGTNPREVILGIMVPATPWNVITRGMFDKANPHGIANFGSPTYGVLHKTSAEVGMNVYAVTEDAVMCDKNVVANSNAISQAVQALNIIPGYGAFIDGSSQYMTAISMEDATAWDVFTTCRRVSPGYICATYPFGLESRLFFGKPFWPVRYDYRPVALAEDGRTVMFSMGEDGCAELSKDNYLSPSNLDYITEWKPFQQIHVISSFHNLIKNEITASSDDVYTMCQSTGSYNGLLSKDGKDDWSGIQYLDTDILPEHQKMLYVTNGLYTTTWQKVIDISQNLRPALGVFTRKSSDTYSINALRDSVMDMYKGHALIIGDPSIKPHDLVYMSDMRTEMTGMFQVKEVIHLFSWDTGMVSTVSPDLLVEPIDIAQQFGWEWVEGICHNWLVSLIAQGSIGYLLQQQGIAWKIAAKIHMRLAKTIRELQKQIELDPNMAKNRAIVDQLAKEYKASVSTMLSADPSRIGVVSQVLAKERVEIALASMSAADVARATQVGQALGEREAIRAAGRSIVQEVSRIYKAAGSTLIEDEAKLLLTHIVDNMKLQFILEESMEGAIDKGILAANRAIKIPGSTAQITSEAIAKIKAGVKGNVEVASARYIGRSVSINQVRAAREVKLIAVGDDVAEAINTILLSLGKLTDLDINGNLRSTPRFITRKIIEPLTTYLAKLRQTTKIERGLYALALEFKNLKKATTPARAAAIWRRIGKVAAETDIVKLLGANGRNTVFQGALKVGKLAWWMILVDGLAEWVNRNTAKRQTLILKPLMLNGREFSAGINGHMGAVIGDHKGYWDGVISAWTSFSYNLSSFDTSQGPGGIINQSFQTIGSGILMLLGIQGPNYAGSTDADLRGMLPGGIMSDEEISRRNEYIRRFFAVEQGAWDELDITSIDNSAVGSESSSLGKVLSEVGFDYKVNNCGRYACDLLVKEGVVSAKSIGWTGPGSDPQPSKIQRILKERGMQYTTNPGSIGPGMLVHVMGPEHWFVTFTSDDGQIKVNEANQGVPMNTRLLSEVLKGRSSVEAVAFKTGVY